MYIDVSIHWRKLGMYLFVYLYIFAVEGNDGSLELTWYTNLIRNRYNGLSIRSMPGACILQRHPLTCSCLLGLPLPQSCPFNDGDVCTENVSRR